MLHVFDDKLALSTAAANLFVQEAAKAVAARGRFVVALTGGSSPVALYRMLAEEPYRSKVDWARCFVLWGDERWVPLSDERSNFRMSGENLLSHVPVPAEQVYPMWAEGVSPEAYAATYEQMLRDLFPGEAIPSIDLLLLGMGDDGHTASLFPHTAVLNESEKLVAAYFLEPQQMHRITLTAPLLNAARNIVFLTFGAGKARALYEVLAGERNPAQYPSQLIRTDEASVHWMVDREAAAMLPAKS